MDADYSAEIPQAFVAGEDELKKLTQLLSDRIGNVVYGAIAVLIVMGITLNRFRDTVFPRSVFLTGQGKARFQQLERFQWGVVIAFAVSFTAGVVIAVWQAIAA